MTGRNRRHSRIRQVRASAMPDITPVVNVALVLLIIFMVVMPMVREGIEVETPRARTPAQLDEAAERLVVVSVQSDGALYVNLNRVDKSTLKDELALAYRGQEGSPVIIKGAQNLPYSEILALMEVCQGIGAPGVDLMARKERGGLQP
jgi:biopolymer transport protein ExbD